MGRNSKEEAAKTRERILKAALILFSEKGYNRTTFVHIAARIGVSKGAVYWHFKNKPSLLAELIRQQHHRLQKILEQQVPSCETLDNLRAYFLARMRLADTDATARKFLFFVEYQMEWSSSLIASIKKQLEDLRNGPFEGVKRVLTKAQQAGEIRADINIDEAAVGLLAFGKGLSSIAVLDKISVDLYPSAEVGIDLMLQGLRGTASTPTSL